MKACEKWNNWIKFFIEAIINQANKNIKLIEDIDSLYDKTLNNSRQLINSLKVIDIINVIFQKPVFTKKIILDRVDIPGSTLNNYLNKLEEHQIIYSDGKVRNKKYYFYDLISLLR